VFGAASLSGSFLNDRHLFGFDGKDVFDLASSESRLDFCICPMAR
jgi:hypothetical protein